MKHVNIFKLVTFNSTETRIIACQEMKLVKAEQVYNARFLLIEHSNDQGDEKYEDSEDEDEGAEEKHPMLQHTTVTLSQLRFLLNAELNAQ